MNRPTIPAPHGQGDSQYRLHQGRVRHADAGGLVQTWKNHADEVVVTCPIETDALPFAGLATLTDWLDRHTPADRNR